MVDDVEMTVEFKNMVIRLCTWFSELQYSCVWLLCWIGTRLFVTFEIYINRIHRKITRKLFTTIDEMKVIYKDITIVQSLDGSIPWLLMCRTLLACGNWKTAAHNCGRGRSCSTTTWYVAPYIVNNNWYKVIKK